MGFSRERLAAIAAMEPEHFWFAGRRALIENLLDSLPADDQPLLDVGCGTGSLVTTLAARGRRIVGLDQRPEGIREARERLGENEHRCGFVLGDAERLPFANGSFAGAFALDVLEHLDDKRLIAELTRVVRPKGWILVTVPALPLLWSQRDELAGHRRRYTRTGLVELFESAGLSLETLRGYQFALLPLLALSRLLGRRSLKSRELEDRPSPLLNGLLRWVNLAEVRLGVDWPIGSSFAVLGRKPG